jgi:2-iminobutanoate/2-iminopropanoate deaminase
MEKTRVESPWGTTFSDSVTISGPGRFIYISGQIGADNDGKVVSESFAGEAAQCFERIRQSLEWAGATMADVVKITGYVTGTEFYADYDAARGKAFAGNPPSSATVQVAGLVADARVEVEAIAFLPGD